MLTTHDSRTLFLAPIRTRTAACSSFLLALASCASPPPEHEGAHSVLAFTIDNDYFTSSDDNYTNGVAFTGLTGPVSREPDDSFARSWAQWWSFLPGFDPNGHDTYVGTAVGQEMYTPDDISDPNPPQDDQPYAGVLFWDWTFADKNPRMCSTWKIRLGVVGPLSGAEEVQTNVHEWIDDDEPLGWDTQLPNEPIVNIDYNLAFELAGYQKGDFGARLVPIAGGAVGNYFTGASLGGYGEVGWNLPDTVGALSLRLGVDPVALVAAARHPRFSVSAFLGGGVFAVGHFLPLDGTVFRDSRSVDSEPFIGFASTGLSIRRGRFAASYLLSSFSDTFETERNSADFGRLTLSWSF